MVARDASDPAREAAVRRRRRRGRRRRVLGSQAQRLLHPDDQVSSAVTGGDGALQSRLLPFQDGAADGSASYGHIHAFHVRPGSGRYVAGSEPA